ncbi:MAG: hypothetical protein Kow0088_20890 [Anaerolineales bacterium]
MNKHDVLLLQQISGYPLVTITLPTHRTAPDNQQDPIRVKNLVSQAVERLLSEFAKREVEGVLRNLDQIANQIDYRNTLDGLALFVHQEFSRLFYLPFPLKERVVIDQSFYTRDLVFALNRMKRYWVLVLSENPTRLFEGVWKALDEIREGGFPMVHEGPGGAEPLPGGFGIRKSHIRDEYHRKFFRQVDQALKPFLADDPLPLVVVGVDRYLAFFDEVTDHQDKILTTLTGNYDQTPAHELAQLVWPLVELNLAEERKRYLVELEKAIGERKVLTTIGEIWRYAQEGRGKLLLVEENFHYPAKLDESGHILLPADDPSAPGVIDDAVDEIIEAVLSHGGQVRFLEDGMLTQYQHIALILRY